MTLRTNSKRSFRDDNYLRTPSSLSCDSIRSSNRYNSSNTTSRHQSSSTKSSKAHINSNEWFLEGTPSVNQINSSQPSNMSQFIQYMAQENIKNGYNTEESTSAKSGYNLDTYNEQRLSGGTNRRDKEKLILSPSECKVKAVGLEYLDPKTQVNVIIMQLNEKESKAESDDCEMKRVLPRQKKPRIEKNRTRATQTLY
ncbi:hypothetical protein DOY81_005040, partial [Sarcophaga bullata]